MSTYKFETFPDEKIIELVETVGKFPRAAKRNEIQYPGSTAAILGEAQRRQLVIQPQQAVVDPDGNVAPEALTAPPVEEKVPFMDSLIGSIAGTPPGCLQDRAREERLQREALSTAEILGRKLFLGSMFLGLVPTISVIGAWNCQADGLTPQIRTSVTVGILVITGLLWFFFYACLEDHEKEILPMGAVEFLKYLILSILGAIAVFLGCMLFFYIILAIMLITSKVFHGVLGWIGKALGIR